MGYVRNGGLGSLVGVSPSNESLMLSYGMWLAYACEGTGTKGK